MPQPPGRLRGGGPAAEREANLNLKPCAEGQSNNKMGWCGLAMEWSHGIR